MVSNDTTWRHEPPDLLARADAAGDEHLAAFFRVIEDIPAGQQFSVNDIRARLDALEIPNTKRGGLMHAAKKAGLIENVVITAWGHTAAVYQASSGNSARCARVARYRRVKPDVVGGAS